MKLQTQINLQKQPRNLIEYQSKLLLIGSCFSDNIGHKLDYFKFQNLQNPFGILFHPIAIENLITNALNDKKYKEEDIFPLNEQWHCFDAHSKLSAEKKNELIENLNTNITNSFKVLNEASHIIITLGTAWVYRHIESDKIVANCHKVPQKKFIKELLSIDDIYESLSSILALIKAFNKDATVIFTVSPIRHLKDGFIENTLSKSHLLAGIHQLVDQRKKVHYFPSYEIMMDELRDYRFYAEDMIHPNKTAINYIWEKFKQVWFSDDTSALMKEIDTIQKGLAHKPFNKNSESHQVFLNNLQLQIAKITQNHPHIIF